MKFKQVREPKAKEVPSFFCRGQGAFLGSLLNCGVLVQQCCAYPNQMAFAHSSPLSLCIFKDCLIKETLVNKLDVLEFYLHLLGSVEFNVLEKTHPTLYFQTPVYFKVFLCNLSCECCLVYVKDSMT